MQQMKTVDYFLAVAELAAAEGSRFDNAYDSGNCVRLRLRKQGNEFNLLIEPGVRLHLSHFFAAPQEKPSSFVEAVRRELDNAVLDKSEQLQSDRLVALHFLAKGGKRTLVFEQFGKGNAMLLDERGKVIRQMRSIELGGRKLHAGSIYEPPAQGESSGKIADAVAAWEGKVPRAVVYYDGSGALSFAAEPVEDAKGEPREFTSFNEALDSYYKDFVETKKSPSGDVAKQFAKLKHSLEEQKKRMVELEAEEAQAKRAGELIFENFEKVEEALAKAKDLKEKEVGLEL
jgi:predicted ribosome quality control (RQC) complex YloA/Tae2 family protein